MSKAGKGDLLPLLQKALIEKVKKENEEFCRLFEEHQDIEKRLEEFNRKRFLDSDEEIEKKRIQKIKLYGKDRMAAMGIKGDFVIISSTNSPSPQKENLGTLFI